MTWGIPTQEPKSRDEALQRARKIYMTRKELFARGIEPSGPPKPSRDQLCEIREAETRRLERMAWQAYIDRCREKGLQDQERAAELIARAAMEKAIDEDGLPEPPPHLPGPYDHVQLMTNLPSEMSPGLYFRRIVSWVARRTGFLVEDILGNRRAGDLVKARHLAMQMCGHHRRLRCMSIAEIGRRFNRDHTTILYVMSKAPCLRKGRLQKTKWAAR